MSPSDTRSMSRLRTSRVTSRVRGSVYSNLVITIGFLARAPVGRNCTRVSAAMRFDRILVEGRNNQNARNVLIIPLYWHAEFLGHEGGV